MNATAAALVRANGVVASAVRRRHAMLTSRGALRERRPVGRRRASISTAAALSAEMDREEASRRGAAVADADLRPSARAHSPVGEVPSSVGLDGGGRRDGRRRATAPLATVSLEGDALRRPRSDGSRERRRDARIARDAGVLRGCTAEASSRRTSTRWRTCRRRSGTRSVARHRRG